MESNFANLNPDILRNIAAPFSLRDLMAASLVCKSWGEVLRPLRESMKLVRFGRLLKHGGPEVEPDIEMALDCFLLGAANGSTAAMVEAGLVYWKRGDNEEEAKQFRRAAELGDAVGQFYLGTYYNFRVQPTNPREAMKWFKKSAENGYIEAQYELALCLNLVELDVNTNMGESGEWFRKAAKGGCFPAMYFLSLCYSYGFGGVDQSHKKARKWLKKAADHGYSEAQLDLGLALHSERDMMKAAEYLELAERGGETEASHVKEEVLQKLTPDQCSYVMNQVNNWPVRSSWRPNSSNLSYFRM